MFFSVLELELSHILQEQDNGLEQSIVITRAIDDIDDNLDDLRADEYADVTSGSPRKRDWNVYNRLRKIKEEILPKKVILVVFISFRSSFFSWTFVNG